LIQGQQVSAERETEQIIGTVSGIVQKGPDKWQAVVIPDGSQYAKNLWTKDAGLIGSLSQMIGQRLAFACNISEWIHQSSGQPVRSLWIDAVGAAAPGSPAMQGPPYVQEAQQAQQSAMNVPQAGFGAPSTIPQVLTSVGAQPYNDDPKQDKIHRQTASKVAAILLSNLKPEERTMDTLLQLAERLVAYYDNGLPVRTLDDEITRAMPRDMDSYYDQPVQPYTGDDDIPF
jgi:hypothetical protein